jgi:hypothetical protein
MSLYGQVSVPDEAKAAGREEGKNSRASPSRQGKVVRSAEQLGLVTYQFGCVGIARQDVQGGTAESAEDEDQNVCCRRDLHAVILQRWGELSRQKRLSCLFNKVIVFDRAASSFLVKVHREELRAERGTVRVGVQKCEAS